jgi:hypothetical protein
MIVADTSSRSLTVASWSPTDLIAVGISILRLSIWPGVGDRSRDIRRLHRAEQAAAEAGLDGQLDLGRLELRLERLRVLERVELARSARGLDLVDLLLAAAGPRRGEALGDEVVAGVPVLDLDHVTGGAETRDLVREDDLCHCRAP